MQLTVSLIFAADTIQYCINRFFDIRCGFNTILSSGKSWSPSQFLSFLFRFSAWMKHAFLTMHFSQVLTTTTRLRLLKEWSTGTNGQVLLKWSQGTHAIKFLHGFRNMCCASTGEFCVCMCFNVSVFVPNEMFHYRRRREIMPFPLFIWKPSHSCEVRV